MSSKKKLEDIYVKLTHKEQILTRPDTYIGSVEKNEEEVWVYEEGEEGEKGKMVSKKISFVPGLFKIFDEVKGLFPTDCEICVVAGVEILVNKFTKLNAIFYPFITKNRIYI